ncbi:hypothetical protein LZZ85_27930 [Terrimonas sp. NA20]|uniref:Uncharacterized protein n=1 Tax=Terrimonas ginsenosidimutans TaxID=2908004 RepID=A0ABS9L0P5_9BACT|nr:hypothetical protein [Terrimonas ginsenosidimutans]MCG2618162.1 hypothetical protein [Terrimonas ginsenosidimutans]
MRLRVFSLVIVFFISSKGYSQKSLDGVDFTDSSAVNYAISKLTLCEEISLLSDSVEVVVQNNYYILVLLSVSKQTKANINIPVATGGMLLSDEDIICDVTAQIQKIKNRFCSK